MNSKTITLFILCLFSFSKAQIRMNNVNKGLKCFLDNKELMAETMNLIELIFFNKIKLDILFKISSLLNGFKVCFGDIMKLFSKNDVTLMQVKKYEAPLLLRKHIFDYINNNGLINAEEECQKITEQEPYVSYRKICNLLK